VRRASKEQRPAPAGRDPRPRARSPALKKLVAMVGRSGAIYRGIADLCGARLRDSEGLVLGLREAAFCALRSQLLMALHDGGATDLCAKARARRGRPRSARAGAALARTRAAGGRRAGAGAQAGVDAGRVPARPRAGRPAAARARALLLGLCGLGLPGRGGAGEEEPNRALGDAGMVLRDPATMHLIISQALRRLEALVAGEGSPAADADLGFMTRLLQHALGCRGMLRERAFAFAPPAPELLHTFYPLLMAAMVEAELHDADTVDGARARRPRRFFVSCVRCTAAVRVR